MTKNNVCTGGKTVRVIAADGSEVGSTYQKRAVGLVKKGRACFVNDFTIRLDMSDTIHNSEVIEMDHMKDIEAGNGQKENKVYKLYFNARNWKFNRDCNHNVGCRSFMEGPDGVLAEAYMIGDWGYNNWTEIVSETLLLPKNTDCSLTFWLNGGENDRNDEVCRFEIIFNNEYEQRYIYNLNRSYIKPLKKLNGWELYEIPFRTLDNEYAQMKFVAQKAYMTVMAAKDVSEYAHLADKPDLFEGERPQRHNLIFADGFPTNNWYSTEHLMKKHGMLDKKGKPVFTSGGCPIDVGDIWARMDAVTEACEEIQGFDAGELIAQISNILLEALEGHKNQEEIMNLVVGEVADLLTTSVDEVTEAIVELSAKLEEIRDALLKK